MDAYTTIAAALQSIIATEFAPEEFTAIRDNLHGSQGQWRTDIGIAPVEDVVNTRSSVLQETFVEIRFYDLWTQEISPDTIVDPSRITGFAERLKHAIRRSQARDPGSGEVWYFDVRRTSYPEDPTGNKSRFHMLVRAYGNNAGLVETT